MAKANLELKSYLAPMPMFMIATYGGDVTADVMNMAWGSAPPESARISMELR